MQIEEGEEEKRKLLYGIDRLHIELFVDVCLLFNADLVSNVQYIFEYILLQKLSLFLIVGR